MSRVGKAPISLPSGVSVDFQGAAVSIKGPKGSLDHTMPQGISASETGGVIDVVRSDDTQKVRALHGLTRSLLNNMVEGVTNGFMKELSIVGVGYRAQAKGTNALELALGFSHSVSVSAPDGVEFEVPDATTIKVVGIDKQLVGQVAADIRSLKKPEPYKGKGIRYTGEHVIRKAGKAAK